MNKLIIIGHKAPAQRIENMKKYKYSIHMVKIWKNFKESMLHKFKSKSIIEFNSRLTSFSTFTCRIKHKETTLKETFSLNI